MKRMLCIACTLLLLCCVACARVSQKSEPLTLSYRGVALFIGMDEEEMLSALGKDYTVSEAQSCAGQGLDRLYTYPSVRLYVFAPQGGKGTLTSVSYTDDTVMTSDGLYIGCTADEVIARRGEPTQRDAATLVYRQGEAELVFSLRDGHVTGITLMQGSHE